MTAQVADFVLGVRLTVMARWQSAARYSWVNFITRCGNAPAVSAARKKHRRYTSLNRWVDPRYKQPPTSVDSGFVLDR